MGWGWLLYVDYSFRTGFHKMEVGQSQDQLESILGKPSGLEEADTLGARLAGRYWASCVKEHVWTVGFDDTKRVVWKWRMARLRPGYALPPARPFLPGAFLILIVAEFSS